MAKVLVVYDSKTGNTERMAEAVVEGAKSINGVEVIIKRVGEVKRDDLTEANAVILGSPNHYRMPTMKMIYFLDEVEKEDLKGKTGGAFGSYGWETEAVEDLVKAMKAFEMKVLEPGLAIKGLPDDAGLTECWRLGRAIAGMATET